ncbi:L-rhamnose-proton symporter, partial [termite gut metagenome]
MTLLVLYGIFLITIGAFMSGSFSIPFDKVKQWKWETSWLVYCLFGYIIVPLVVCLLTVPDFIITLKQVPFRTLLGVFLLGAVYGAANLTFGLSLRYLGLALGYALSLGLMMAIGTLVPPALDGRLAQLFEGHAGIMLISGIGISLIVIFQPFLQLSIFSYFQRIKFVPGFEYLLAKLHIDIQRFGCL